MISRSSFTTTLGGANSVSRISSAARCGSKRRSMPASGFSRSALARSRPTAGIEGKAGARRTPAFFRKILFVASAAANRSVADPTDSDAPSSRYPCGRKA